MRELLAGDHKLYGCASDWSKQPFGKEGNDGWHFCVNGDAPVAADFSAMTLYGETEKRVCSQANAYLIEKPAPDRDARFERGLNFRFNSIGQICLAVENYPAVAADLERPLANETRVHVELLAPPRRQQLKNLGLPGWRLLAAHFSPQIGQGFGSGSQRFFLLNLRAVV